MSPIEIGGCAVGALIVLIYLGLPIGIGMLTVSFFAVALIPLVFVAARRVAGRRAAVCSVSSSTPASR